MPADQRGTRRLGACVFGARASRARLRFALIGDSHTEAWTAALGEVGPRGARLARDALHGIRVRDVRAVCDGRDRGPAMRGGLPATMCWLRKHPEIDFVIATAEVDKGLPGPASTIEARKLRGFQQTFRRFPRNVRRVIVLRDTPNANGTTFDCLDRVVRAGRAPAGPQCATPRRQALPVADAAFNAALFMYEARYRAVDMTDLMCSPAALAIRTAECCSTSTSGRHDPGVRANAEASAPAPPRAAVAGTALVARCRVTSWPRLPRPSRRGRRATRTLTGTARRIPPALALVCVAGAVLRFATLDVQSLWY